MRKAGGRPPSCPARSLGGDRRGLGLDAQVDEGQPARAVPPMNPPPIFSLAVEGDGSAVRSLKAVMVSAVADVTVMFWSAAQKNSPPARADRARGRQREVHGPAAHAW